MELTKRQRELLSEHTEYIIKKVRKFHFIPPLHYQDCTGYVLEKLCQQIKNYNNNKRFLPFLNKLIRDNVFNYYRKKQIDSVDIMENAICDNTTPESDYWKERENEIIKEEINKLEDSLSCVIDMYYYSDLNENEIARKIGISQSAVSQRIARAKKLLKPKIAERLAELEEIREQL